MKRILAALCLVILPAAGQITLRLNDDREFNRVEVIEMDREGVKFSHQRGKAQVKWSELPEASALALGMMTKQEMDAVDLTEVIKLPPLERQAGMVVIRGREILSREPVNKNQLGYVAHDSQILVEQAERERGNLGKGQDPAPLDALVRHTKRIRLTFWWHVATIQAPEKSR